jgi:hypothetical protein
MSGMVTDDSETNRPDNLESEVVGRACGVPDIGGIIRMDRISNSNRITLLDCVSAECRARREKMLQNTPVTCCCAY